MPRSKALLNAYTIDRFEGDDKQTAVLLAADGRTIDVPRSSLPEGAKPGDVLGPDFAVDPKATRRVARATRRVQNELAAGDDGGDIKL